MLHRLFCALALVTPLTVSAVARADTKIGYVDLQRALLEIDEGRQAKQRLQQMVDQKQKDIDKEQNALRKEKELLDKQSAAMSEETRLAKQTELQKKLFEFAQKWDKQKQEMQVKERTELQAIFAKMDPLIATIAQRENFTMVFEKTDSGLVYAPSSLDLTNELVRMYNDQSKKGGAAGKGKVQSKADAKKGAPKK
jgi:outer membrane protein